MGWREDGMGCDGMEWDGMEWDGMDGIYGYGYGSGYGHLIVCNDCLDGSL